MPDVIWTLRRERTARERTLEEWGIRECTRRLINQGLDTCTLSLPELRPARSGAWAPGEVCTVLRDGAPWFQGRVAAPARAATGTSEGFKVTLNGPWSYLERLVFQQLRAFVKDPLVAPVLPAALPAAAGPVDPEKLPPIPGYHVTGIGGFYFYTPDDADGLNGPQVRPWNGSWGADGKPPALEGYTINTQRLPEGLVVYSYVPIPTGSLAAGTEDGAAYPTVVLPTSLLMLGQDDLGGLMDASALLASAVQYALDRGGRCQLGVVEPLPQVPAEQVSAATCADVVRRALRWTPDVGTFWDYSTEPPTFRTQARNAKPVHVIDCDADAVESIDLAARFDLVLAGVTLQYLRRTDKDGQALVSQEIDSAGPDPVGFDALVVPIELNEEDTTPVGLAQRVYDARKKLHYAGTVVMHAQDCSARRWLGRRLNVTGADPDWSTMEAEVQIVTEQVVAGKTTLECGPPDHLGPADFVALLRATRGNKKPDPVLNASRQTGGTQAPPPTVPPPPSTNPGSLKIGPIPPVRPDQDESPASGHLIAGERAFRSEAVLIRYGTSAADVLPAHATADPTVSAYAPGGAELRCSFKVVGVATLGNSPKIENIVDCDFSRATLDLRRVSPLRVGRAELIGFRYHSSGDGSAVNEPFSLDVTSALGRTQRIDTATRLPGAIEYVSSYRDGAPSSYTKYGGVVFDTLRLSRR